MIAVELSRLSADRRSPHYFATALLDRGFNPHSFAVLLDGKLIEGVVEADVTEGWVDTLDCDDAGAVRVNDTGDEVAIVRRHGYIAFFVESIP